MSRRLGTARSLPTPLVLALAWAFSIPAGAASLVAPFQGNHFAYLSTGPGSLEGDGSTNEDRSTDGNLEADLATFSLEFFSEGPATLRFAGNLLTSEISSGIADFFLVELTHLGETETTVQRLLGRAIGHDNGPLDVIPWTSFDSVDDLLFLVGPDGSTFEDGQTGWETFSFEVGAGTHRLRFSLFDEMDSIVDTALLIDDIRLDDALLAGFEGLASGSSLAGLAGIGDVRGSATIAGAGDFTHVVVPLPAAAWCLAGALGLLGGGLRRRPAG